jgi:hypothetical protein
MLCSALGNQPPAGMPQYPQQTNQGLQARGGQCGQQQKQGQQGQPSGGGGGTTNGGRQNGLYRGNNTSGGTNPGSTFNSGGGSYPTQGTSTLHPHSRNSTIGTIAIPMAATSITTTQVPPVRNLVSITNMRPPGPT